MSATESPTYTPYVLKPATIDDARAQLRALFGYPDFRTPQIPAVESVISGRDTLIVLPTGGGKSLCYQVPALVRDGLTVVISPLISLMKDQVDALERRGIAATFINSTLGAEEGAKRMKRAESGTLKMLYLAPEKLEGNRTIERLRTIGIALLAVDEAHCISEWGHDFRPSYRRIGSVRLKLGDPQTVALTATATPEVRSDIAHQLKLKNPKVVVGGFDRTNLTYHVVSTPTEQIKNRTAVDWLRKCTEPAIVYTPTRKAVERVTAVLVHNRINAVAYHGGLDEKLRQRSQDAFMHERARVIVATSAFGMGIDKPDVRLVVHHAMPGTLEAYYQEAGRAGRDGNHSVCVLLHAYPDRFTHEHFIMGAHPERSVIEQTWRALCSSTDGEGLAQINLEQLTTMLPKKIGEKRAAAAVRALASAGAISVEPPSTGRVFIRLLAAPSRISTELTGARLPQRDLLRALWRMSRDRIETGASVDLDELPRSYGGTGQITPILKQLESDQFVMWSRVGGGFRLDERRKTPLVTPIDWSALEKRRKGDMARLDAMQGYAQCRTCRRAFVLRYFGDAAARPRCDACDRCIGSKVERSV